MRYDDIHAAIFIRRVNRFVAEVEIDRVVERVHVKNTGRCAELCGAGLAEGDGRTGEPCGAGCAEGVGRTGEIDGLVERVHVKNTGRCAELLVPGYRVWLERSGNPGRRTAFDLIGVEKPVAGGVRYVNMDSMAPNRAAGEWLAAGGLGRLEALRAEVTVGDSRFDFAARQGGRPVAIEVKGCTLEDGGVARFPDAPTLRGLKHVRGLTRLAGEGWRCVLLVVIQMKGAELFMPNWDTQPEFGAALLEARRAGVEVLAMDCVAVPGEVRIDRPVRVALERGPGDIR